MTVEIVPATGERFADVAAILAPKNPATPACWCLTYRITPAENSALRGEHRPNRLRELCERDVSPGLIAYVDGQPAGWCAIGPRTGFARLERSRTIPKIDDAPVWSVVCFIVRAPFRRQGLAHAMLDAAVDYARAEGVTTVEGYPIDPSGSKVSANFVFVGTTGLFESAGFERVVETSSKSGGRTRWLMRRQL